MKHANFSWPPAVVPMKISTFCSLCTCTRELFFLHIYMVISEINYPAPSISKYNFWCLLNLRRCNFVDEMLACTRELFSGVHPVLYYPRTFAWPYCDLGRLSVIYSDVLQSEWPGFDSEQGAHSASNQRSTGPSFTGRNVLKKWAKSKL